MRTMVGVSSSYALVNNFCEKSHRNSMHTYENARGNKLGCARGSLKCRYPQTLRAMHDGISKRGCKHVSRLCDVSLQFN